MWEERSAIRNLERCLKWLLLAIFALDGVVIVLSVKLFVLARRVADLRMDVDLIAEAIKMLTNG